MKIDYDEILEAVYNDKSNKLCNSCNNKAECDDCEFVMEDGFAYATKWCDGEPVEK